MKTPLSKIWQKTSTLILMLTTLALWSLVSSTGLIAEFLLPSPFATWSALVEFRSELISGFLETFTSSAAGLGLSFIFGNLLAVSLSMKPSLQRAVLPLAIFFQTVPIVAIAPLLVIWFGFGKPTVMAASLIVSFFPVLANTLKGLSLRELPLEEVFDLYKASSWQKLIMLRLPLCLPFAFAGLEVAAGLSVIGAIVGEFVGGGGLGSLIDSARTQQRTDLVFAAVFLSSLLGAVFMSLIKLSSKAILLRRPYFTMKPQ